MKQILRDEINIYTAISNGQIELMQWNRRRTTSFQDFEVSIFRGAFLKSKYFLNRIRYFISPEKKIKNQQVI